MKLEIELIPRTTFFTNVRSIFPERWSKIRKACYSAANNRCEICDGVGESWPVECHEVWHYDFKNKIQKLVRLIALCPACHEVKHFGLANLKGRTAQAKAHLMLINGITEEQADVYIAQAFAEWHLKNKVQWKLDVTAIEEKK